MSELTLCNFCSLRNIKARALAENKKVMLRNSKSQLGGKDVFVVPKKVKIPKVIKAGHEKQRQDNFSKKYWRAWFMAIGESCEC